MSIQTDETQPSGRVPGGDSTRDLTTVAGDGARGVSLSTLPERVGRYILGRLIDGGGMGRVFKAVHEETGAEAAIKIMRTDLASADAVERFRQEGRLLAKVRHPNIAQVYDAGTTRVGDVDTPYIAMEYIPEARTIREYARTLDTDDLLRTFIKVCRAVHHVNDHGIVHRDLKPSNILVDAFGEPKVIDFGVAKNLDQRFEEGAVVTLEGNVPGTLPYMAPEQVLRRGELIDRRTDVYALGVVLYELICGRLPYRVTGVPLPEAMRVICEDEPTEPTRVTTRESLGRDLRTVLLKMLAKTRLRRYQSAEEVARELERLLEGKSIEASPTSVLYQFRWWLSGLGHREPVPTAVVIWVLAVLLTMFIGPRVLYRGLGLAGSYAGFLLSLAPVPGDGYENVVVIGLDDVEDTAKELDWIDLPPRLTDPEPTTRGRPLIGAMLERLAECEPQVVAVDFRFNAPDRAQYIVDGILALREKGIVTVVGSTSFVPKGYGDIGSTGLGAFDESIAQVAPWGSVSISRSGDAFAVRLAMRVEKTGAVFPSFGLMTLASASTPTQSFGYSIEDGFVRVSFENPGELPGLARRRGIGLNVPYTEVGRHPKSDLRHGIMAGDMLVNAATTLPEWAFDESEPSTIRLGDALTMSVPELRRRVAGRAVMIIDIRPGFDQAVTSDGRTVHKGYVWASWLDQALDGRSVRGPGKSGAFLQIVIGGFLGAGLFLFPTRRRRVWAFGAVVAFSALALIGGIVVFEVASLVFVPLLGVTGLVIAGLASAAFPKAIEL
jgi:protein kinase-like protein/CHASE2 domain-containing protein